MIAAARSRSCVRRAIGFFDPAVLKLDPSQFPLLGRAATWWWRAALRASGIKEPPKPVRRLSFDQRLPAITDADADADAGRADAGAGSRAIPVAIFAAFD